MFYIFGGYDGERKNDIYKVQYYYKLFVIIYFYSKKDNYRPRIR